MPATHPLRTLYRIALSLFIGLIALSSTASDRAGLSACVEALAPTSSRALPLPAFAITQTVAWNGDGKLLIGLKDGIVTYDPVTGSSAPLVPGDPIPNGLSYVVGLDSDGKNVFAFNLDYSDLLANAKSGQIAVARRHAALQIASVAIRGDKVAVLGFPVLLKGTDFAQLWIGDPGAPWETFLPLHPVDPKVTSLVRFAIAPYGGAVTFANDDTVAMISPAEPGIFRYRTDGTPLPTLGRGLRELVVPRIPEATKGFAQDPEGRYREVLNKQPTIDGLVATPDGLAIVVRRWSEGAVGWELWFPDADGVRRRIRLELSDRNVVGGHLHCSARGAQLACVFSRYMAPPQLRKPELAIFDLKRAKRLQGCA